MCGKSIPPPQNAGFQSAGSVRKSRSTRPKDGAVSRGEKEDCRARPWPPSSSTGGFASRRRARSGGWLRFPRDGTVPTTKPSSSGAASRSPWCGLRRGRVAGLRNVPNRNCSATAVQLQCNCSATAVQLQLRCYQRHEVALTARVPPSHSRSGTAGRGTDRSSRRCTHSPRNPADRRCPAPCDSTA